NYYCCSYTTSTTVLF
nr:immunoglobulin light chain junction region [Macaca mulatta]